MLRTNEQIRKLSVSNDKLHQLTEQELKDVQKALLEMMADFDRFCRDNHLCYFLCGGSALGAVRHRGFIPWDEDVDLAMPREDYNRFEELFMKELSDRYHIQSIHSSDVYDLPFLKIRKKGTRFLEIFEPEPKYAGLFLDVYPLENVPDFWLGRMIHGIISDALHFCCSCVRMNVKKERYFTYFDDQNLLKSVKIKALIGKFLGFFNLNRWCKMADSWAGCCKNNHSKYVTFPGGRKHYFGEMFLRCEAFEPKEIEFEDKKFLIFADPKGYLKALYGNYSELPPENRRERHAILELDLGENNG